MNKIDQFFSDYIKMSYPDYMSKYSKPGSYTPTKEELLKYFQNPDNLKALINNSSDADNGTRVMLVEEKGTFKVYSLYRDLEVFEETYNELLPAAMEKMERIIDGMKANRR